MVQFRGINIGVVSQFDAKRLPEHSTARAFDATGTVVACYIPVYAGAQIWLEYSIDGPHPPKAAYFFRMLLNGQVVTSWDCTAKHEYQGKVVYVLQTVKSNVHNQLAILQKSIAFGSTDRSRSPNARSDCIEIRVHRIEHRRRIRALPLDPPLPKPLRGQEALRIKDHGLIEPYRPARRYQYQLLDPQDDPYATFRFYCRTQDYLERHQIIDADRSLSPTSLATSASNWFDPNTSPEKTEQKVEPEKRGQPSTPTKTLIHELSANSSPVTAKLSSRSPIKICSPGSERTPSIKDSIEDLPSMVPRSPQSPRRINFQPKNQEDIPPSPTQHSSPLLPEALNIRKHRSPSRDANPLVSDCPILPFQKPSPESPIAQSLPPPQLAIPSPPSTASPRPTRLPYQRHKPFHLNLNPAATLTPPLGDSTTTAIPHRPLSPFTQSGLLRRLSYTSNLRHRRPSTPTPLIPTVQEVDAAVEGLHGEKTDEKMKDEDKGDTTPTSATKTVRRKCSAGLLNGLLGRKSERRAVT